MPSTVIRKFAYDADRRELHNTFVTGRRYIYEGVPPEAYNAMLGAFAKGGFFNREIRRRYRFREVA